MTDGPNRQTHACSVRKCGSGALLTKKKKKREIRESNQICHLLFRTQEAASKNIHCIQDYVLSSRATHQPTPTCKASHPVSIKSHSSPKILIYEHLKSASMRFILKRCYMPTQEGSENRHMIHSSPRSASCLLVLLIGNMWSSSKQPMGALALAFLQFDRLAVLWAASAGRACNIFHSTLLECFSQVCVGDR